MNDQKWLDQTADAAADEALSLCSMENRLAPGADVTYAEAWNNARNAARVALKAALHAAYNAASDAAYLEATKTIDATDGG